MNVPLRLLCIFPHPDDESLGMGGTLAKYAAEGIETYMVCATRGERGWGGPEEERPSMEAIARIRQAELVCATQNLGMKGLEFLDYIDGEVDRADVTEITSKLVSHIRRIRPQVVVTFGPDGVYGHPDHIAMSQFTQLALLDSANHGYRDAERQAPHQVSKLYYMIESVQTGVLFAKIFGDFAFEVDGEVRQFVGWPDWMISTHIDAAAHWKTAVNAIQCHQSQIAGMKGFSSLSDDEHRAAWGQGDFYRAFSTVNHGRIKEQDLFEGLR